MLIKLGNMLNLKKLSAMKKNNQIVESLTIEKNKCLKNQLYKINDLKKTY